MWIFGTYTSSSFSNLLVFNIYYMYMVLRIEKRFVFILFVHNISSMLDLFLVFCFCFKKILVVNTFRWDIFAIMFLYVHTFIVCEAWNVW